MAKKYFTELVDLINGLTRAGVLESEDKLFLKKELKNLGHAISVRDVQEIEKTINKISKTLLQNKD